MTKLNHRSRLLLSCLFGISMLLWGCDGTPEVGGDAGDAQAIDAGIESPIYDAGVLDGPVILGGVRPVEVYVPTTYRPTEPMPLIFFLHGYGFTGAGYEESIRLTAYAEERGFLYVIPEGNLDANNAPYWNAFNTCCDFLNTGVDDSSYLRGLIEEATEVLNVDATRIHIIGHSNGGFMSYRMACDHADLIASFASISGAMSSDPADCTLSEPVSALQVHGTADQTILFAGGAFGGPSYPSATGSAEIWAARVGCQSNETEDFIWDLDAATADLDTSVTRYDDCDQGGDAELWTVEGGGHVIAGTTDFFDNIFEFLDAHAKPE